MLSVYEWSNGYAQQPKSHSASGGGKIAKGNDCGSFVTDYDIQATIAETYFKKLLLIRLMNK